MSQTDRKWDGDPHSEKKRLPAEPPNKLAPRKQNKPKPTEYTVNIYTLTPRDFFGKYDWWWSSSKKRKLHYVACLGMRFGGWAIRSALDHVVKRKKAVIRKSRPLGIYWMEEQGTKRQLSPEFSNFGCFINWMIYEGFAHGWLYVDGFKNREGEVHRRLGHK